MIQDNLIKAYISHELDFMRSEKRARRSITIFWIVWLFGKVFPFIVKIFSSDGRML